MSNEAKVLVTFSYEGAMQTTKVVDKSGTNVIKTIQEVNHSTVIKEDAYDFMVSLGGMPKCTGSLIHKWKKLTKIQRFEQHLENMRHDYHAERVKYEFIEN